MDNDIKIVREDELRKAIRLDRIVVDVVERAFAALGTGKVVMPPILSMEIADANGEVDVKTAYIPGFDGFDSQGYSQDASMFVKYPVLYLSRS